MGWLLMSRFSVIGQGFKSSNSQEVKEMATNELEDLMARSISIITSKFPIIDNIVLACEGGTWRKTLPVPDCLGSTTYKGNRTKTSDWDWCAIYKATNTLIQRAGEVGITVAQGVNIEGDDWAWYWSRRLNSEGVNVLIWSSDCDLKQLVIKNEQTGAWTGWYNDKAGLVLPTSIEGTPQDDIDFFMKPQWISPILEQLKTRALKVEYINPAEIVLEKVMRGDSGDNIMAVARYQKGDRTYKLTEKDWCAIREKFGIDTVLDLDAMSNKISQMIYGMRKYDQTIEELQEMIKYNLKLVWLDESSIPFSILSDMNQIEYKLFNIQEIRNNYKILLPENDTIKNLFESEDVPF